MVRASRILWVMFFTLSLSLSLVANAAAQVAHDAGDALEQPTPLENWQIIVGFLLPGLLAIIIQTNWSRSLQSYVSMGIAMLASIVAALLSDKAVEVPAVIVDGLKLFAVAITAYYGLWKPTGAAPKIEAATSKP